MNAPITLNPCKQVQNMDDNGVVTRDDSIKFCKMLRGDDMNNRRTPSSCILWDLHAPGERLSFDIMSGANMMRSLKQYSNPIDSSERGGLPQYSILVSFPGSPRCNFGGEALRKTKAGKIPSDCSMLESGKK